MFRTLAFLSRKSSLTPEAFRDYYETRHVPLILSITSPPPVYNRRYVQLGDPINVEDPAFDFDVVTEMGFESREACEAWGAQIFAPGNAERVKEDEAAFLDRARTRVYVFDVELTTP